jgi:hypothetical protein
MAKRLELINNIVKLISMDDMFAEDIEECLSDFMLDTFNVELEDNSAK